MAGACDHLANAGQETFGGCRIADENDGPVGAALSAGARTDTWGGFANMQFTKQLREGVRRGKIRCSIRIWTRPHVKVGGRYRMEEGEIVVDSIRQIALTDVTPDLARASGFESIEDLLRIAKHGRGDNVYLVRFHYLPPGVWEAPR